MIYLNHDRGVGCPMIRLAPLLLFLSACNYSDTPPIPGPLEDIGGFRVHITSTPQYDYIRARVEVSLQVHRESWTARWVAEGYNPAWLLAQIHEYPIVVFVDIRVPGGADGNSTGWIWYGSHIEVSFFPVERDQIAMPALEHEWDHVILGDFH